jgi:hypothetical protein
MKRSSKLESGLTMFGNGHELAFSGLCIDCDVGHSLIKHVMQPSPLTRQLDVAVPMTADSDNMVGAVVLPLLISIIVLWPTIVQP